MYILEHLPRSCCGGSFCPPRHTEHGCRQSVGVPACGGQQLGVGVVGAGAGAGAGVGVRVGVEVEVEVGVGVEEALAELVSLTTAACGGEQMRGGRLRVLRIREPDLVLFGVGAGEQNRG